MAVIGGPLTGTGVLRGTAIYNGPTFTWHYDNYSDTLRVTPGSTVGSRLFGDIYDAVDYDTESDDLYGALGNDTLYGDTGPDPMYKTLTGSRAPKGLRTACMVAVAGTGCLAAVLLI